MATTATASGEPFQFPEMYNFPPFFTLGTQPEPLCNNTQNQSANKQYVLCVSLELRKRSRQPNESTWKEQRRQWCDLVLAYYRHNRLFSMSLAEAVTEPPFANRQLRRALRVDVLREIVDELVKQGNAVWVGAKNTKDTCLVFWRKPEVWASMIHQWASERGLFNSVLTVFELANGDDTVGQ
ncbi:Vacuolar protein-sorting-associated protein 25, partial [Coemansia sp. RSA 922]